MIELRALEATRSSARSIFDTSLWFTRARDYQIRRVDVKATRFNRRTRRVGPRQADPLLTGVTPSTPVEEIAHWIRERQHPRAFP